MDERLSAAIATLRSDGRGGRPVRVELDDGTRTQGELTEATDTELSLFRRETQSVRVVPLSRIRVLWMADVRRGRYQAFMGTAGLVGVAVAMAADRLGIGPAWAAAALGVSAVLVVLLAGWTAPPVRRWLVAWRRVYDGGHERAA
jgi:hypothetical protein